MKAKLLFAAALLAGASVAVNAQEAKNKYYTEKASDNIFIGVGVGGMSVLNGGMNTPTMNVNLQIGKLITPTWGVRGVISGLWQSLDDQDNGYFVEGQSEYHKYCKQFAEINLDAMLNLTTLFGGYNPDRVVDFYLFGGPTMNLSSVGTQFTGESTANAYVVEENDDLKARFGATVGLGLGFNLNKRLALNVEGRVGVTPSIFGDVSDCRKAEATARVNVGLAYTFGGKKFVRASNIDEDAINAEINRYRSELAKAQADLADCRNSLANRKPEVKEVTKEIESAGPLAVFFRIGSARLDDYGKVNIQLIAKKMKANSDKKYKVAGYCDKATGSASFNQKLSEKRAQVVYDALIAEGVDKNQLECVGFGGTENMFGKNFLNRVVIVE